MDLDSILASIAERDKWGARLATLQAELRTLRLQRRRAESRLKKVDRELRRLRALADELVRSTPMPGRGGWGDGGAREANLPVR